MREASEGNLRDGVLLMVSLLGGQQWRICGEREVNTREAIWVGLGFVIISLIESHSRHKVSLEIVKIDVQRTIEPEGCSNRGHDLGD